jgi:hypothetical protein
MPALDKGTIGSGKASVLWSTPWLMTRVSLDGGWADATNPRIDLITYNEVAGMRRVNVIHGTPTPHADLDNQFGVPCLPAEHALITRVLILQASGRHRHEIAFAPTLIETTAVGSQAT